MIFLYFRYCNKTQNASEPFPLVSWLSVVLSSKFFFLQIVFRHFKAFFFPKKKTKLVHISGTVFRCCLHFSTPGNQLKIKCSAALLMIMEHVRATMYLTGVYLRPSFPRFQLHCNPRVQISFGIKVTLMAGLKATSL